MIRTIISRTWGRSFDFQEIGPKLYASPSRRVYLIGDGLVGGKGEGLIFLDSVCDRFRFQIPDKSLIACNDFFELPEAPLKTNPIKDQLNQVKIKLLIDTIRQLGFPSTLAIRSSAAIEDQLGQTAAGIFHTSLGNFEFADRWGTMNFAREVQQVIKSAYSSNATTYHDIRGYQTMPPLAIIIQSLVGNCWLQSIPTYFAPHFSGIFNTATPEKIKFAVVVGFGNATVANTGAGLYLAFDRQGNTVDIREGLRKADSFLDLKGGQLVDLFYINLCDSQHHMKAHLYDLNIDNPLLPIIKLLQQETGFPLDGEWAIMRDKPPYIHQLRPISQKMESFPKPKIAPEQVVFEESWAIGQGEKTIDTLIVADATRGEYVDPAILELTKKYPRNMLVYLSDLPDPSSQLTYHLFARSPVGCLVSFSNKERWHGSGLQHFALNFRDEEKLFLYSEDRTLPNRLSALGQLIDSRNGPMWGNKTNVYYLAEPIRVAADDEVPWGMIFTTV